jgi:hypothetical protein
MACLSLVVIHDFEVICVAVSPHKTDAELIVNAYGILPFAIAVQCVQPVSGWNPEILQSARRVNHCEFSFRYGAQIRWRPLIAGPEFPECACFLVSKGLDQSATIALN